MFIKLDLVTDGKFCFYFSRVLGSQVHCVNGNPSARVALKQGGKKRSAYRVILSFA